jgi:alpha-D-ribose 1-methylphosphonate 5-triphosphate synthase subunit PhnG
MTRKRRTRILIEGDPVLARYICANIEARTKVSITSEPREVLVMNKVRETARNSLFYLGEALLTECKVSIAVEGFRSDSGSSLRAYSLRADATTSAATTTAATTAATTTAATAVIPTTATTASGIGLVMSERHELAYQLAVIDAAFSLPNKLPEHEQWCLMLIEEEDKLLKRAQQGRELLDKTRVEFQSMLTEDDVESLR